MINLAYLDCESFDIRAAKYIAKLANGRELVRTAQYHNTKVSQVSAGEMFLTKFSTKSNLEK